MTAIYCYEFFFCHNSYIKPAKSYIHATFIRAKHIVYEGFEYALKCFFFHLVFFCQKYLLYFFTEEIAKIFILLIFKYMCTFYQRFQ